jgi:hypothetical protein
MVSRFSASMGFAFVLFGLLQISCEARDQPAPEVLDKPRFTQLALSSLMARDRLSPVCNVSLSEDLQAMKPQTCCSVKWSGGVDQENQHSDNRKFVNVQIEYKCEGLNYTSVGTADYYFDREGDLVESFIGRAH